MIPESTPKRSSRKDVVGIMARVPFVRNEERAIRLITFLSLVLLTASTYMAVSTIEVYYASQPKLDLNDLSPELQNILNSMEDEGARLR